MNETKINSAASDRLLSADVAKAIAIFLVVVGHHKFVYESHTNVLIMILSFHMPAFYFISGLFFNPNSNLVDVFRKRIHSLIKPYLSACLLFCLLLFIKNMDVNALVASVKAVLYGNGILLQWPMTALWFMTSLFVTSIVYFIVYTMLLRKIRNKVLRIGCLFMMMFVASITVNWQKQFVSNGLPWNLDLVLVTMFFYGMGYELREYIKNVGMEWMLIFGLIFIVMHVTYTFTSKPVVLNLNARIYDSYYVALIESMSGIAIIWATSSLICRQWDKLAHAMAYIGKRSLTVFMFHPLILPYVRAIMMRVMNGDNLAACMSSIFITIAVCLMLHELLLVIPILRYWIINQHKKSVTREWIATHKEVLNNKANISA